MGLTPLAHLGESIGGIGNALGAIAVLATSLVGVAAQFVGLRCAATSVW